MDKTCIFYASKYHLSLILLKLLSKEDVKEYTVITFLENSIKDEIECLKTKYKIRINSKNIVEFTEKRIIENNKNIILDNMIIIVEGKNKYIGEVNEYIEKQIKNKKNIKIINCYEYNQLTEITKRIKKDNIKLFTTTGEKNLTNLQ